MANSSKKTILIVDDTKLGRLSVKKVLGKLGLNEPLECDNGADVSRILKKEEISLILMDILMPGKNGVETLQELKEGGSTVPVVMITADIQESTQQTCRELGAAGFVSKPVKETTLRSVLGEIGFL
jgi:twitching motility two-component system response regulator PilH